MRGLVAALGVAAVFVVLAWNDRTPPHFAVYIGLAGLFAVLGVLLAARRSQ